MLNHFFSPREGKQGLIMVSSDGKLIVGFLVTLSAVFLAGFVFRGQADAAQLEDACKSRCQAMAEQYKKEKGAPLPSAIFNECVDSCMHPPQINSEADIPPFCKSRCERLLKNINPGANPAGTRECADRCIDLVTQKFRQSRIQGQKGPQKKQ